LTDGLIDPGMAEGKGSCYSPTMFLLRVDFLRVPDDMDNGRQIHDK